MFLSIKPKIIVFFITYKCNSRCIMCSAWQKQADVKDLSLDEIEKIFSDETISSNLEVVNLTGGEPSLRVDLTEIVRSILRYCPRLKKIDIPTNGIDTRQVLDQIEKILALLLPTDIKLSITVALDGVGEVHEKVRQVTGIFKKVNQTIKELKELHVLYPSLSLGLNTVVSKLNYQNLREINDYSLKNNLGINFTLAAISEIGVESIKMRDKFELGLNEKEEAASFFKQLLKKNEIDKLYGKFILHLLETGRRNNGCAFRRGEAVLLEPNGNIYLCGNFKKFLLGNLTQNKALTIWHGREFSKEDWQICKKCESNCYLERS